MKQSLTTIFGSVLLAISTAINEVGAEEVRSVGPKIVGPPMPAVTRGITMRWDRSTKKENLIEETDIALTPHVPVQIGTEFQKNREIAFTKTDGSSVSGGFSAGIGGSLETMSSKSLEHKTGRTTTETYTVTLNPDICLNWRVKKYETGEIVYFSAPEEGMPEEQPIWLPLSRRIEAINLCPPKPAP